MRIPSVLVVVCWCAVLGSPAQAQDYLKMVQRVAEKSTLDQPGTHPFHLRATLAPVLARDKASNRTGEIEIWWQAPGIYRRELRSPDFHQVEVVNGGHRWQKNEGDYLPDWLDQTANAILHPLPADSKALRGIPPLNASTIMGRQVILDWSEPLPVDRKSSNQYLAFDQATGRFLYDGGLGWGGDFKDYADFHGREIPRTISSAKVIVLEDLPAVPAGWFDATAPDGDPHPIVFTTVEDTNLLSDVVGNAPPLVWPEVTNLPMDGVIWTTLVLDRAGRIREPFSTISDNPAINDFMHTYLAGLQFKPVVRDHESVQVVRRVVVRFKLRRPAGFEELGTARDAFERGRATSSLAASAKAPYRLKATFTASVKEGKEVGSYTDTWQDATHWRREAALGDGRFVRSQDGDQAYLLQEGAQAGLARLILTVIEPIPSAESVVESGYTLQHDAVDKAPALRVLLGYAEPGKALDPKLATGYWFDASGQLVQVYSQKLVLSYGGYQAFQGGFSPRTIQGRTAPGGGVALSVELDEAVSINPSSLGKNFFRLPGHEWKRQFTAEVR